MVKKSAERMRHFVAPIYENSRYIKAYFEALGVDFDLLNGYFSTLRDQAHISSVDWGIEFLERKYSVEPAPHLSLEERRARLRIKAALHLPLNPAVLEKFARDNFGFECYLDEATPGFIRIIANRFPSKAKNFVPWLVEEKPAHLALGGKFVYTQYLGEEIYAEPSENQRVDLEPDIPKDDRDKRRFPRMFVDTVNLITGAVDVEPSKPVQMFQADVFAATANLIFGNITEQLSQPAHDFDATCFAGQILTRVGTVKIGTSTQPSDDSDYFARSWTSRIFGGNVDWISGQKVWNISPPRDQEAALHGGIVESKSGTVTIQPSTEKIIPQRNELHAAQVFAKIGDVKIDSATKPSDDGSYFARSWTSETFAGNVEHRGGSITIKDSSAKRFTAENVVRVGCPLVRSGFVTIGCSDNREDWDFPVDGDWLRLWFNFPNLTRRSLLIKDPRDDVEKADIRNVGDIAAEGGILLNSAGEQTTGITRAALIKRREFRII